MPRLTPAFAVLLLAACGRSLPFDASSMPFGGNGGHGAGAGGGGGGGHAGGGIGDGGGTGGTGGGSGGGGGDDTATSCSPSLCGARTPLAGGELMSLESSVQATQVDTAFDSTGRPVVAYGIRSTSQGATQLVVRRLENGHWVRLGCSPGDPGFSTVQLATDEMGNLLVAWIERDGPNGASLVAVAQWDGKMWQMLGAPFRFSQEETLANRVSLVLSRGTPMLAWDENVVSGSTLSNGKVFGAWWDGGQWAQLGDPMVGDSNQPLKELGAAIDVDGAPVILFTPDDADQLLHPQLRKWDGNTWQPIAPPPSTPYVRDIGGFRIDAQGRYYLGFSDSSDSTGTRTPHVAEDDAATWSMVGDGFEPMQDVQLYSVALKSDGTPVVAVTRKQAPTMPVDAAILHWNGSSWDTLLGYDAFPQIDSNIAIAGGPAGDTQAIWSILQAGGFTIHVWNSAAATACE